MTGASGEGRASAGDGGAASRSAGAEVTARDDPAPTPAGGAPAGGAPPAGGATPGAAPPAGGATPGGAPPAAAPEGDDPLALIKSRAYLILLALAAVIGLPVAIVAYFFLELVTWSQHEIFDRLPSGLGFTSIPVWWPLPFLALSGLLVAMAIRYLPGQGGHSPADGFKVGGDTPLAVNVPGVAAAALATLCLGAVLGPEAPLIAIGGGLGALAVQTAKRDAPPTATLVLAAAGSFAAISTLLGSPIIGAYLLMEAAGLGGPTMGMLLMPGLLASGVGYLIFVGLNSWTGFGTFSLVLPSLPHFGSPTIAEFGWAVAIGLAMPIVGGCIRWLALFLRPLIERRSLLFTPVAGLGVAGLAIAYGQATGKSFTDVLFSGQSELPHLVANAAAFSVGALALLLVGKGLAYSISLSSFRGGPIFPAMFLGAAGGILLTHLPGLPLVPAIAIGIGTLTTVMLKLPLTSVLLASLLVASAGFGTMPLIIVGVTVAYVAGAYFSPVPPSARTPVAAPPVTAP